MGLSVITGPTQEPISLAEIKAHLRETSPDQDALIAGYILAAREFVENATRRKLITQTLDFTVDYGWPCTAYGTRIELPLAGIASITSVKYVDSNGTQQTLASDQYVSALDRQTPYIEPAYAVTWPDVRSQPSAVTVRFICGTDLSSVPNTLMQAMRMMVSHWYANREAVGGNMAEVPMGVEALLSPYRYA